jgi:hypothetical protein
MNNYAIQYIKNIINNMLKHMSTFFEKAAKGFMSSSYIFLYLASTSEEPLSISSAYCKAQHNKDQMPET